MFSKKLKNLTPYTPGEQPQNKQYIKLNTNENPYPPSPITSQLLNNWSKKTDELRLYPDPDSKRLKQTLADNYNLKSENIFVGNGSDEVLALAFFSFFDPDRGDLLFPNHTYSFYPVYCRFFDIQFKQIPLNADFTINIKDYIRKDESTGIIIANPNAPTGIPLALAEIKELLNGYSKDRVVVIDEAYVDFGSESATKLIKDYPNLLVVQTFSKSRSLAGQRIGYAMGSKELITAINTAKNSFNSYPVDRITEELAIATIEDTEYFKKITSKIIETRDIFSSNLKQKNWKILPSGANFVFASHPKLSGEYLYTRLKKEGILVRWFNTAGIDAYLRITIGLPKEMDQLLIALDKIESEA